MSGHRLRRRYGRAKGGPRVVHRMATGGLVWSAPGKMQIMWAGPGARLKIGDLMKPGGWSTTIDNPVADGSYMSAKEASAAVGRFLKVLKD